MLDSHPNISHMPEFHFNGAVNLGRDVLEGRNRPFVARCDRAGVGEDALRLMVEALMSGGHDMVSFHDRCLLMKCIGAYVAGEKQHWGFKIMKEIGAPGM